MSDLYSQLGVSKSASADELQKAYRKLAKKYHPDLNPGDASAEDNLKRINLAYGILSDADKRGRYDRGEIDEQGNERPMFNPGAGFGRRAGGGMGGGARGGQGGGFSGNFNNADFASMFADIFGDDAMQGGGAAGGRRGAPRGMDISYTMELSLTEAAQGGARSVDMAGGRTLKLQIPPGTRDGTVLRLRGQGGAGIGGGAGDALVTVKLRPHPLFKLQGDDIHVDLPVSLREAVLGGRISVPTIGGAVTMKVPPGSNSGAMLRLRGRGWPKSGGAAAAAGDQYVRLQIVLADPKQPELQQFAHSLSEEEGESLRASALEQAK